MILQILTCFLINSQTAQVEIKPAQVLYQTKTDSLLLYEESGDPVLKLITNKKLKKLCVNAKVFPAPSE